MDFLEVALMLSCTEKNYKNEYPNYAVYRSKLP